MIFLVVFSANLNQKKRCCCEMDRRVSISSTSKKIDDNFFADAALKKLFVQYNTFLPSSAAGERFFCSAVHRKFKFYSEGKTMAQNSNRWSATANPLVCGTFAVRLRYFFALPQPQITFYFLKLESQTLLFCFPGLINRGDLQKYNNV